MTAVPAASGDAAYRRRVRAWTLYDWANSAFATTILAAVLPVYYSQVAGATLPSEATATAYWSLGLSLTLLISGLLSPVLGTISDVMRGKKRFLLVFTMIGAVFTGLLVLVDRGDWLLASALFVIARVTYIGAITFYDSLLPHVARPDDVDRVSARGFALGYLGGGILLAINVAMIQLLPGTWGPRLSFLSVAVWWLVFSIPLLRGVPEPPAATARLAAGESVVGASIGRLVATFRDIRHYRELFKFLLAFLIYNDAIGTIISLAAIYGAELGLGAVELVLALLLTQFVGIPFSLVFGRLPRAGDARRPFFLAYLAFNAVALPVLGIGSRLAVPALHTLPLPGILGVLVVSQLVGFAFAALAGRRLFSALAAALDTRRALLVALAIYCVIALWAFVLETTLEFWLLAWMVAMVQGGSQALSRSLYSSLSPALKSGEFFGLYGVMEKFSAIAGPLIFAIGVGLFGSSRPAVASLIVFFVVGGWLLSRVNIAEGQRLAREEDVQLGAAG